MADQEKPHNLTLENRKKLTLTGVAEVASFDDNFILLRTPLGDLTVQGEQLQLKSLTPDGGAVTVHGTIDSISYQQPREETWLRRIFG